MRMEPTESSETSAINVTWTPGTYPKDNKLQLEGRYFSSDAVIAAVETWLDGQPSELFFEWLVKVRV